MVEGLFIEDPHAPGTVQRPLQTASLLTVTALSGSQCPLTGEETGAPRGSQGLLQGT